MALAMNRSFASLIPVFLLGACTSAPGDYPSLARRPIEQLNTPLPPATAPSAPVPLDPAMVRQLDSLLERIRAADARFQAKAPQVRRSVLAASDAARGTEAWSAAMIALTDLDTARSDAMVALAEIDAIYAANRITGAAAVEAQAARAAGNRLIAVQDQVMADLQGRLLRQ